MTAPPNALALIAPNKLTEIRDAVQACATQAPTLQAEAEEDLLAYLELKVATDDDELFADQSLTRVMHEEDALTALRGAATKPLYAVAKTVEGWMRATFKAREKARLHLKGELSRYRAAKERARLEAERKAEEAAQAGDFDAAMAQAQAADDARRKVAGTKGRSKTHWAVKRAAVIVMAQSDVARRYLVADTKALNALAKNHKDLRKPPEIPGVEFELVASTVGKR